MKNGFGMARIRKKTAHVFFLNGTVAGCNGTVVGGTGDK